MKTSNQSVLSVLIVSCLACLSAFAEVKIEEQIVAPPWKPGTFLTLSARGMHFASTHEKDGKFIVMIDGVESAPYDQVLNVVPSIETLYYESGLIMSQTIRYQGPVAFSHDGLRHAYAVRMGDDVVVLLDGKEIFRAKQSASAPPVSLMQFTPDGKHLYFYSASGDTMQSFRLLLDGKPVSPAFDQTPQPIFSADGSRWVLNAGKAKLPNEKILVIDAKDPGYTGERPRFSPDGKKVICTSGGRGEQKLLVDGKPIMTVHFIDRFRIGATGDTAAIVQGPDTKKTVYVNGKMIPDTEGAQDVNFSPDGKHWAAKGMSGLGVAWWIVLDGKKQKDYKEVSAVTFSPDSSVSLYYGRDDTGWHPVVNGTEGQAFGVVRGSTFAKTGHKFAYAAGPMPNVTKVYYDGKVSPQHSIIYDLELSPDGEHCAYFANVSPTAAEFIVDGEMKGYGGAFGGALFFSGDSKHIAAQARRTNGYTTIYVDGTFIPEHFAPGPPKEFTPDDQHLIIAGISSDSNHISVVNYYVDGDQVAQFSNRGMTWVNSPKMVRPPHPAVPFGVNPNPPDPDAKDWEAQADGSIIFIGGAPGPQGYGLIKKIKVTPAPGTSFSTWVAGLKDAEAKAIADADTAKQKAAADAAAATAKRKADYDAAVAAKNKARQDAINAKKLQMLNAQRAKQKLPPLTELP